MANGRSWTDIEDRTIERTARCGMRMRDIAEQIGRTETSVKCRLFKLGIKTGGSFAKDDERFKDRDWMYHQYVVRQRTTTEIGKVVNAHRGTILYWLRKFNIKRRKSGYTVRLTSGQVSTLKNFTAKIG